MWFTGCSGCVKVARFLPEIERHFRARDDVVFISLSVDRDRAKWLESIAPDTAGTRASAYRYYITEHTEYLNTGGLGSDHAFIRRYNPSNVYPTVLVIGKKGELLSTEFPLPLDPASVDRFIRLLERTLER